MPTTIAVVSRDADARGLGNIPAIMANPIR